MWQHCELRLDSFQNAWTHVSLFSRATRTLCIDQLIPWILLIYRYGRWW
jgi:hypothetical protein